MNSMRIPSQEAVERALAAEDAATPKHLEFVVVRKEREAGVWKVKVDVSASRSGGMDESLEGARAWWAAEPNGSADVLSALPDDEMLHLRFASREPPNAGERIRIYPPMFLESLIHHWHTDVKAEASIQWLRQALGNSCPDPSNVPRNESFPWLRTRQREAFDLPQWPLSFLWGPPGTGKTTALGALLGSYLMQFPTKKVLLFSTTNVAVDVALVSLDVTLETLGAVAAPHRRRCFRLGHGFHASRYSGREHLIPTQRPDLIGRLNDLESNQPDRGDAAAFAAWKDRVDAVKREMRQHGLKILGSAQLAALTVARGLFTWSELASHAPYDLMAFDEASQVGIPHAMALAPLARHCIFAGDPCQLAPITRSEDDPARLWLGRSMFAYNEERRTRSCFLDEQSRMVPEICNVVSNLFYEGRLRPAADKVRDVGWNIDRSLACAPRAWREPLVLREVQSDGIWSQKYKGYIRHESAEAVCDVVATLSVGEHPPEILVLTPFRAQRSLVRAILRARRLRLVRVSTVHRAQGSEEHTIIFDPVAGASDFLLTADARRLINVALSRAAARLVVILSPGDRENPVLRQLGRILRDTLRQSRPASRNPSSGMERKADAPGGGGDATDVIHISSVNQVPDFPKCVLGKRVRIGDVVGTIVRCAGDNTQFTLKAEDGKTRSFSTKHVRRI